MPCAAQPVHSSIDAFIIGGARGSCQAALALRTTMRRRSKLDWLICNENGLRVQKTAASTGMTRYTLHSKNVVHMTQGSNELHFFYDAQNKPAVVVYNGTPYSYVKNLQGDIVAILDSNKNAVVQYRYSKSHVRLCRNKLT